MRAFLLKMDSINKLNIGISRNTGRTHFKKGATPWNKGLHIKLSDGFVKGHEPWNKGIKRTDIMGDKNWIWRGNDVSYGSLHKWVRRHLGIPGECAYCGFDTKQGRIEWASVSHEAKRDLKDYLPLCIPCHRDYDKRARV